ncbi:glycosyltransferase family 39 protein [Paenibacillus sp. G2S3]|uniref:glycosyltransferase family 39 protein n=1 Tax=Paenibacillus sp. G2S3 TaxID=3047872 RepID=UPI0024C18298|nr:glycosyltransferase family 39 protein [Paenibacillus sp. G2S3]WHY20040.1 glycosyltransferase family 39 protein [Paenibacillus sp. G2S3]
MLSTKFSNWYSYFKNNPWPLLLFLLGAVIRILYFGSIPGGLNQDEASIGYDAYAILHYGIDRNGIHLPIHLIAWGSGQNALYAYLSMPFILMFGLTSMSIRAVSLIMGLLGMLVFYLLSKELFNSRTAGIAAMFFIAINPWHIMMSRWALESNLFPTMILLSVYMLLKSFQTPKWFYGFTLALALSLYAYGTSYFFVPIFALGTGILLFYKRALQLRTILWNIALFILLALPIFLFVVINRLSLEGISTPIFSIPKLTTPRMDQVTSIFGGQLLHTALSNFQEFMKILISGSDGLLWNSISPYGYAYPIALPFVIIGLIVMLRTLRNRGHEQTGLIVVLLWFFVSVLMAFVTNVNINRINVIFYPIILLIVAGFIWLIQKVKALGILSAITFSLFFVLFSTVYFRDYPKEIGPAFYESFGEAIQYASEESAGNIYVTDKVNMPYIYVLFYEQINPHDFLATVNYSNPGGAFQQVSSFGKYRFGNSSIVPGEAVTYIFWNGDAIPAESDNYTVKRFANYTVVKAMTGEVEGISEFTNGGFEEGISGWNFSSGTGVATNNPYNGSYLAYLDPGFDKTITQSIRIAEPGEYKLGIMVSAGGEEGRVGVRVNGVVRAETKIPASEVYQELTLPMVSIGQNEQTEIFINGGKGWINIDEVRLER